MYIVPDQFNSWWRHQVETFSALPPFVRGIHRWPVNSPHKGQWSGALMFSLICINGWVNKRECGDPGRRCAHNDVTVMWNGYFGSEHTWELKSFMKRSAQMINGLMAGNSLYSPCAVGFHQKSYQNNYREVSNISRTLVSNEIVDHSDVVGTSTKTTSSFST